MDHSNGHHGKRRRWFQFRIRTLLVFVLLLSLPLSWLAVRMREARLEREALEHLISLQTSPSELEWAYDYQIDADGKPIPGATCPGPAWAKEWLGEEFFCHVAKVTIRGSAQPTGFDMAGTEIPRVTIDEWMAPLEHFPGLRMLWVCGDSITAKGLSKLVGLRHLNVLILTQLDESVRPEDFDFLEGLGELREFSLCGDCVTDEHLRRLPALPELRVFGISGDAFGIRGKVTGEFLEELDAPKLEHLFVSGCPFQDASLVHVRRFPWLKVLDLGSTPITDEGLRCLRDAPLVELDLFDVDITDEGLAVLATMPRLESLHFVNVNITDVAFRHLARIPKLKELWFRQDMEGHGPYITKRAVDEFQKLRPLVQVADDASSD